MVLLLSGENQMLLSFHDFDEANFSLAQQLSVQWPRPCTQKLKDVGKTVLLQPGRIFSALRSAFLSVTLTVRGSASSCVCYLCVMISVLSYNGWEWLILLLHHALASGVPHGSLLGPTFVEVGFTRWSQGTAGLIGRWGYHWFIQFHHDDTKWRNINEIIECVRRLRCIGYVLICLSGRAAGFLPRWSSGFSSAWWTSSAPVSPSAFPQSEAAPLGSQLDDNRERMDY